MYLNKPLQKITLFNFIHCDYSYTMTYKYLLLYLFICFLISLVIFLISFMLIKQNSYFEKLIPYECGFEPYEDTRNVFSIQFYLIGLLFLIFDLESMYLYPLINSLVIFSKFEFICLIDFFVELLIGYIIVYKFILNHVIK
jgi:NADH-quinone oxidoreductase subunit A